jgi:hypothetical protein
MLAHMWKSSPPFDLAGSLLSAGTVTNPILTLARSAVFRAAWLGKPAHCPRLSSSSANAAVDESYNAPAPAAAIMAARRAFTPIPVLVIFSSLARLHGVEAPASDHRPPYTARRVACSWRQRCGICVR